jgi:hypothetical protein
VSSQTRNLYAFDDINFSRAYVVSEFQKHLKVILLFSVCSLAVLLELLDPQPRAPFPPIVMFSHHASVFAAFYRPPLTAHLLPCPNRTIAHPFISYPQPCPSNYTSAPPFQSILCRKRIYLLVILRSHSKVWLSVLVGVWKKSCGPLP